MDHLHGAKTIISQAVQFKTSRDGFLTRADVSPLKVPYSFEATVYKSRRPSRDTATRNVALWYYLPGQMFFIDSKIGRLKNKFTRYSLYVSIYDRPYFIVTITRLAVNNQTINIVEHQLPKASLPKVTLSLSEIFGREISKMEPVKLPYPSSDIFVGHFQKPNIPKFREFAKSHGFNSEGAFNFSAVTLTPQLRYYYIHNYMERTVINPWRHTKIGERVEVDGTILFVPTQNNYEKL